MLSHRTRIISGVQLLLLCAVALSGCVAEKKVVDPYRDPAYTRSVAQEVPDRSRTAELPEKKLPPQSASDPFGPTQVPPQVSITSDSILPLLTLVDDRIVSYEGKVEQWEQFRAEALTVALGEEQRQKIDDCHARLLSILAGYNTLHARLINESSGGEGDASILEGFLAAERNDLAFLESDCQQRITAGSQAGDWVAGTIERMLEVKEKEIADSMTSGEYQQVIELYSRLPLEEGQRPSYQTSYYYGQALLKTGREGQAAEVFQDMLAYLREQSQLEEEFKLMQLIADLQFGMENYDRAFERYTDIINRYAGLGENIDWARKQQSVISVRNSQSIEVRNFAELMRGYLAYNVERDAFRVFLLASSFLEDFPDSAVIPTVNHILFETRDRAEAWFAMVLQRIGSLKGEKKYQEALQYIDQLPLQYLPVEKREQLNALSDELISSSFVEEESRRKELEAATQEIWNRGQDHLRAKEYDQAIEVFSGLLDTDYADRANDKIVEASQLAAQEDRRKAAELFVLAGQERDQIKKLELLMGSRALLRGILEKYPQSGLVDKAQKNLERIEEDIKQIDPALLAEPEQAAGGPGSSKQPAQTTINGLPLREWQENVQTGFPTGNEQERVR